MNETYALTTQQKALTVGRRGVQLTTFEDAWRFSQAVIQSGFAPPSYQTPQQVLIAVQRGAEVGLPPMQALDVIAVINGRPTIYGDGLPALVESSGLMADSHEWIDGEGDNRTAHCRVLRRGQTTPLVRSFSVADAKRAKLWGKSGPWTQYPDRMLAMRARAFAYRDKFADCLRGLQVREEVEDYATPSVAALPEPTPVRRLSEIPDAPAEATPVEAAPETSEWTPVMSLRSLRNRLSGADTDEQVDAIARAALSSKGAGRITDDEHASFWQEAQDRKCALVDPPQPQVTIPDDEIPY